MSTRDTMFSLLPAIRPEAVTTLEAHWTGVMTPEMRKLLQTSCGLHESPIGSIDFTGRWFAEEPLPILRPSLTLAVDEQRECRWIAELRKKRGLPGPVWCIFSRPEVALWVDKDLSGFLERMRDQSAAQWLNSLSKRARKLWALRHCRAMGVPVAFSRLKELRGWLAALPSDAWIYDLRAPESLRGLPYGLMYERGPVSRCGRLMVFAFSNSNSPAPKIMTELMRPLRFEHVG